MNTPDHDENGNIDDWCGCCGRQLGLEEWRDYARHGVSVCERCADAIANHYSFARSGKYLTWENELTRISVPAKKPIPEAVRWRVFERDNYACLSCGSREYLRADHVVPESEGGEATMDNLQTLCRSCNSRKGASTKDYR